MKPGGVLCRLVALVLIELSPQVPPKLKPAYHPVQEIGAGPGADGGALTAISAARAGVPTTAIVAIAVASFFMGPPKICRILPCRLAGGCCRHSTVKEKTRSSASRHWMALACTQFAIRI